MKKATPSKWFIPFLLFFIVASLGCQFDYDKHEYKKAIKEESAGNYKDAIVFFSRVIKRSPDKDKGLEAAKHAARLAYFQTHEFKRAVGFYRHLIVNSPDELLRLEAQKHIADIYFEKIGDYKKALEEFHKLIEIDKNENQKLEYRYKLARSYFYLEDFYQAQVEVENILSQKITDEQKFQYTLFKGNILQTTKKLDGAIKLFRELQKEFPEQAQSHKVGTLIAACYEEQQDFDKAIEILTELRGHSSKPGFLDLKIRRLKQRQKNQPGARGFRK